MILFFGFLRDWGQNGNFSNMMSLIICPRVDIYLKKRLVRHPPISLVLRTGRGPGFILGGPIRGAKARGLGHGHKKGSTLLRPHPPVPCQVAEAWQVLHFNFTVPLENYDDWPTYQLTDIRRAHRKVTTLRIKGHKCSLEKCPSKYHSWDVVLIRKYL